jgi:hypothetical protein
VVPKETFNDASNGGDAIIDMIATVEVDPEGCDLPTYISVDVTLFVSSASDINGNGKPDECEPVPGDFDGDLDVDRDDLDEFEACASGPEVPMAVGCEEKDFDNDGDGDQSDFAVIQRCYSGENVFGDPDCAD